MARDWKSGSWRSFEARQQPLYPDAEALAAATAEIAAYPPLVPIEEAIRLKRELSEAQSGRALLLQGGDCAESFAEFSPANIRATFALVAAIARELGAASGLPIIRVARMAGQFAKPRSTDMEIRQGHSLPAYRGDIINGIAFEAAARTPQPERMFRAYAQAAATIAHLRDLAVAEGTAVYTSHEALLLPFEEALVRSGSNGRPYASSAHLVWIGDRTRFPGSAHVEFARGLANPIAIKCGPTLDADTLLRLLDILDPEREPGRVTLITRMGAGRLAAALPPLIRAVRVEERPVLWACDPMHGNTVKAANGYKTRPLSSILAEVRAFFALLPAEGAIPGGIHIEMTGSDVAECTGGMEPVREQDLGDRYHTHCDPRLNARQALELAATLADALAAGREAA